MDAAIAQLLTYCEADPVFFEPPWRSADHDSRFPAAGRTLPDGWRRGSGDLWVMLEPPGIVLPDQGWKIHVSANLADAEPVCDLVVDFCLERGLTHKFLRSRAAMRLLNSKYADRRSSGKLLTLYPVDEHQFSQVLPALAARLRGRAGPYVLSDLRYLDSPVYVRYGAFRPMTYLEPNGDLVYAIRDPEGRLVPDSREPTFTVPEWVTVPEVLRESVARLEAGGDDDEFPFDVERPLHFSNGGGVYLARDQRAGGYVVLLEARPHAGLDGHGSDAVARLRRERDLLQRLDGLRCVPRVLEHRTIWEHDFLVEEYIEGTTLLEEVFERYPLAHPQPTAESLADYTRWAIDILAKVDHALMSVHSRGVRFVDLHPANIIIRPDGSVALIDFEIAADLEDVSPAGLATPGFAPPAGLTGRAADAYVLNCLRQWVFLPISPLAERDRVKLTSLSEVITEHFPVPPGFGARMLRHFAAGSRAPGEDLPARMFVEPHWPTIRDSMVAGIVASATPQREDRLFPGDPHQHMTGGFTVDHGAAGVLWALHQVGWQVPEEYLDWLVAAVRRATDPRPGLLDGLYGVAVTLAELGRRDDALEVLERARTLDDAVTVPGIHSGLAGFGLALLRFHELTGDEKLGVQAHQIADTLAGILADDELSQVFAADGCVGLQRGLSGVALFLIRLYERTADPSHLDLAHQALRREIDHGQLLPDGTFQLLDGNRYHAYLGTGSIGLALVLSRFLRHRPEAGFGPVIDGARRATGSPFIRHPFLFMGRAGTIAALSLLADPQDRQLVRDHVRRLGWHALSYQGELAFPGNQLLRLSMDLATGSAGVLVALGVAFGQNASVIPVLDLRSPAFEDAERR